MKQRFLNILKKLKGGQEWNQDDSAFSFQYSEELDTQCSQNLIDQTVQEWLVFSPTLAVESSPRLDRVLARALEEGVISEADVTFWIQNRDNGKIYPNSSTLQWQQVIAIDPWRSQQFQRMAARMYGFRSVLVCQMSTLVLVDMLTSRISAAMWNEMFEIGLIPVVEHGHAPLLSGRIACISKDPTSRRVRNYVNGITAFESELTYADAPVVSGMLDMIAQHIPAVGAAVYVSRPTLLKLAPSAAPNKRAA